MQSLEKEKAEGKGSPESEKMTAEMTKLTGQDTCGKAGKSYTGEYDCADGKSRVKCE